MNGQGGTCPWKDNGIVTYGMLYPSKLSYRKWGLSLNVKTVV